MIAKKPLFLLHTVMNPYNDSLNNMNVILFPWLIELRIFPMEKNKSPQTICLLHVKIHKACMTFEGFNSINE